MGTWNYGILDNDEALDLKGDFEDTHDLSILKEALEEVYTMKEGEYVEAPEAQRAIAAIALLKKQGQVEEGLLEKITTVIDRILTNSELKELWEESGEYEAWKKGVQEIII